MVRFQAAFDGGGSSSPGLGEEGLGPRPCDKASRASILGDVGGRPTFANPFWVVGLFSALESTDNQAAFLLRRRVSNHSLVRVQTNQITSTDNVPQIYPFRNSCSLMNMMMCSITALTFTLHPSILIIKNQVFLLKQRKGILYVYFPFCVFSFSPGIPAYRSARETRTRSLYCHDRQCRQWAHWWLTRMP